MSGPIPAPPSIGTADGSRIIIAGTPAAGMVPVASGPNAATWATPGGGGAIHSACRLMCDLPAASNNGLDSYGVTWNRKMVIGPDGTEYGDDTGNPDIPAEFNWAIQPGSWIAVAVPPGFYDVSVHFGIAFPIADAAGFDQWSANVALGSLDNYAGGYQDIYGQTILDAGGGFKGAVGKVHSSGWVNTWDKVVFSLNHFVPAAYEWLPYPNRFSAEPLIMQITRFNS